VRSFCIDTGVAELAKPDVHRGAREDESIALLFRRRRLRDATAVIAAAATAVTTAAVTATTERDLLRRDLGLRAGRDLDEVVVDRLAIQRDDDVVRLLGRVDAHRRLALIDIVDHHGRAGRSVDHDRADCRQHLHRDLRHPAALGDDQRFELGLVTRELDDDGDLAGRRLDRARRPRARGPGLLVTQIDRRARRLALDRDLATGPCVGGADPGHDHSGGDHGPNHRSNDNPCLPWFPVEPTEPARWAR
jgi:hypothetical protein